MKRLLLIFACFSCLAANAQTKLIAFKSHSGSAENFSLALENNLFDMAESDFGLPPTVTLDSVILVKKSVAVIVTSRGEGRPIFTRRDTLRSKKLFNKKISLDSLRTNIHKLIKFDNSPDSVKFIGFDKSKASAKQGGVLFITSAKDDRYNPLDGAALSIGGLILLASLIAGLLTWKWNSKTLQPA
jgi:hypothetical protein